MVTKCALITAIVLFALGALLLTAGLVVELAVFPSLINSGVKSGKVLGKNSDGTLNDFTSEWKNPNYKQLMQYWTFDYKNTIGIMNRAIYPDMVEKGPYTYVETLINDIKNFSADGEKMTFSQATMWVFDRNQSCPTCDPYKDLVTVPDVTFIMAVNAIYDFLVVFDRDPSTLIGELCGIIGPQAPLVAEICKDVDNFVNKELGTIFDLYNISPFVTVTVDQLLYSGYEVELVTKFYDKVASFIDNYFNRALPIIPPQQATFALNAGMNASTPYVYTCLTGKSDSQQSGIIDSFYNVDNANYSSNGNELPSIWWPSALKCGATDAITIRGTNADYFQSFIKRSDRLPIYVENLCRSVNLVYEKDVKVRGIDGYRYLLPASEFNYSLPENCGYQIPLKYGAYNYPAGSPGMPTGILDISQCSQGAPIMISKPHFYQASDIVSSFVPRFKSTYDNDETTLDIEPITGTVLSAMKRIQINLFVNQFKKVNAYKIMRPGAYPLVWLNESFLIDDGTKGQLNSQLFLPQLIVAIISWTAVGVGGLFMIIAALIILIPLIVKRKDVVSSEKEKKAD